MTVPTQQGGRDGYVERPGPAGASGLADVTELILGKGLVIDAYVQASLVGIEILTTDAPVLAASVETYLRFAAATKRLDLYSQSDCPQSDPALSGLMADSMSDGAAKGKTHGALDTAVVKTSEFFDSATGSLRRLRTQTGGRGPDDRVHRTDDRRVLRPWCGALWRPLTR